MALIENNVVSKIGIPDFNTSRFKNHPAGAALTNIAQSIRSSNYNFEEEQLLGCDRIVTRQYDNSQTPCYRETIEFRPETVNNKYYYIEYFEYDLRPDSPNMDVKVINNKLSFNLHNKINETFNEEHIVQIYKLYQKVDSNTNEFISKRTVTHTTITENGMVKPMVIEEVSNLDD